MHSNSQQKQYKIKISIRSKISIVTGSDKYKTNKVSIKTSSTGNVKDIRETKTTINLIFVPYKVHIP